MPNNDNKDTKHDAKRSNLARLPSSRLKSTEDADIMNSLYQLANGKSKLSIIVDAAKFALLNKEAFLKN